MLKGLIIAITGQSGVGKTSFSKMFVKKGYTVIDCDKIAAEVLFDTKCIKQLAETFGQNILSQEKIDKKLLAKEAFKDEKTLQALNDITHPFIIKKILQISQESFAKGYKFIFVDGAAIIGQSFEKYCDKIIVVVSDKEKQYNRLVKRDNITFEQAKNRIAKQTKLSDMLKKADFIVYNNQNDENLYSQAKFVLNSIQNSIN